MYGTCGRIDNKADFDFDFDFEICRHRIKLQFKYDKIENIWIVIIFYNITVF